MIRMSAIPDPTIETRRPGEPPELFEAGFDDPELAEVLTALSTSVRTVAPQSWRARSLRVAIGRREPSGRPGANEFAGNPIECYEAAHAAVAAFIATITNWNAPTVNGFDVHGLVAHLAAVETWFGSTLGALPFALPEGVAPNNHLAIAGPLARSWRASDSATTVSALAAAASATVAALRLSDLSETASFYELTAPRGAIVIARTFELWTHEEDLRRATGQPLHAPPASTLGLMTDLGVRALPRAVALAEMIESRTIEITLTGAGAGHWLQVLDGSEPVAEPSAHLICDATEFCRVIANRCSPAELLGRPTTIVTGAPDFAEFVLFAARGLASD